jgi:hypothetical protein
MVRLRSEALLGSGGGSSTTAATTTTTTTKTPALGGDPRLRLLVRLLQGQGLLGVALVALDAALGAGVLFRHWAEGACVRLVSFWGLAAAMLRSAKDTGVGHLSPLMTVHHTHILSGAKALGYVAAITYLRPKDPRLVRIHMTPRCQCTLQMPYCVYPCLHGPTQPAPSPHRTQFARLSLAWAILLLGGGVLLPIKRGIASSASSSSSSSSASAAAAQQHMTLSQLLLLVVIVLNSAAGVCLALALAARDFGPFAAPRARGGLGRGKRQ